MDALALYRALRGGILIQNEGAFDVDLHCSRIRNCILRTTDATIMRHLGRVPQSRSVEIGGIAVRRRHVHVLIPQSIIWKSSRGKTSRASFVLPSD